MSSPGSGFGYGFHPYLMLIFWNLYLENLGAHLNSPAVLLLSQGLRHLRHIFLLVYYRTTTFTAKEKRSSDEAKLEWTTAV